MAASDDLGRWRKVLDLAVPIAMSQVKKTVSRLSKDELFESITDARLAVLDFLKTNTSVSWNGECYTYNGNGDDTANALDEDSKIARCGIMLAGTRADMMVSYQLFTAGDHGPVGRGSRERTDSPKLAEAKMQALQAQNMRTLAKLDKAKRRLSQARVNAKRAKIKQQVG